MRNYAGRLIVASFATKEANAAAVAVGNTGRYKKKKNGRQRLVQMRRKGKMLGPM